MPKILEIGKFNVYVNANDHKPPHAHVRYEGKQLLINLQTMEVIATDFNQRDTNSIISRIGDDEIQMLLEAWERYHG